MDIQATPFDADFTRKAFQRSKRITSQLKGTINQLKEPVYDKERFKTKKITKKEMIRNMNVLDLTKLKIDWRTNENKALKKSKWGDKLHNNFK
jgi:hypothetical protein